MAVLGNWGKNPEVSTTIKKPRGWLDERFVGTGAVGIDSVDSEIPRAIDIRPSANLGKLTQKYHKRQGRCATTDSFFCTSSSK